MPNIRKNITMSLELAAWYEEKAKNIGVSQSALMVMALNEYIKQDKTIAMMSAFESMVGKFDDSGYQEENPKK